jgi:hypothetical protein
MNTRRGFFATIAAIFAGRKAKAAEPAPPLWDAVQDFKSKLCVPPPTACRITKFDYNAKVVTINGFTEVQDLSGSRLCVDPGSSGTIANLDTRLLYDGMAVTFPKVERSEPE